MSRQFAAVSSSLLLWLFWSTSTGARTWKVPAEAPTVRAAIDSAGSGDTVLLAPGTYTWTSEAASGLSMLTLTKQDLTLRGEAGAASTFLDAESQGRILRGLDAGNIVIEGITFQNGTDLALGETQGGAVYLSGNSHMTVRHCAFRRNGVSLNNASGGAIKCGSAVIENCEFIENTAGFVTSDGSGGAIYCISADISDCVFKNNRSIGHNSSNGGAIRSVDASSIRNCIFENNSSGAFRSAGAGAVSTGGASSIDACVFRQNTVGASEISCSGGAVSMSGIISNCLFIQNEASAAFTATARAGALGGGRLTISQCVFIDNRSYHVSPDGPGFGGAIRTVDTATIENCTFIGNSGGDPTGVGGIFFGAPGIVRSSIISSTTGLVCSGQATWSCSNLFGNAEGNAICGTDGGGNFSADPEFCATDPVASLSVFLQQDSPCAPGNHPQGASCGLIGAAPVGCGTVGVEKSTWSLVKQLFR